jgi:glyoxylase-like metal-dependent hydrolase (beta-lactamase superfamily II)
MLERKPIFPNVIEINHQLGHLLGCNVYVVFDQDEWLMIDIGYEESVDEIIELIRQLDFPFSQCKTLIATHADVDHIQGLAKAKQILRTGVTAHPKAASPLEAGDRLRTFAEIEAQGIDMPMDPVTVDHLVDEGDVIQVGRLKLEVWLTPGHTDSQLSFRLGDLLFSGDNIYRDGCVGAIDAHHGSNLVDFVASLERIEACNAAWLLPSHGPVFPKDNALIRRTIDRLKQYLHMADFGTCAIDWPLMDQFEKELRTGQWPTAKSARPQLSPKG